MKLLLKFEILLLLVGVHSYTRAAISIDSVSSAASTCVNNGSITVYATTNAPPLFYAIVDGPHTLPLQNSNQFNNLEPGVYQIEVSNFYNETTTQFIVVTGSYQFPEFEPEIINTTCSHNTDGRVIGHLQPQTGHAPFVWKITNSALGTSVTQSTDVFNNLAAGTYTLQVTDSCQNTTLHTVQVNNGSSNIDISSNITNVISACYATDISFSISSNSLNTAPIIIRVATKNGVYVKPVNFDAPGHVLETVLHVGYGDTINITLYNGCGDSVNTTDYIDWFDFNSNIWIVPTGCNQGVISGGYLLNDTYLRNPVHYVVADSITGTIITNQTLYDVTGVPLSGYTPNRTYRITITDGCGNTFTDYFTWPSLSLDPPTVFANNYTSQHCRDSTAGMGITCSNFSAQVFFKLISGPSAVSSSKPHYAFTDSYIYNVGIPAQSMFHLANLTAGTYVYQVYDNCGHSVTDSFTVTPNMLADDNYKLTVERGCPGNNSIIINLYTHTDTTIYRGANGIVNITNISTGASVANFYFFYNSLYEPSVIDTIAQLPAGTYAIEITYKLPYNNPYLPTVNNQCISVHDTVYIPAYTRPSVSTAIHVMCHNNSYVELVTDSNKGMFPYTYEIVTGPQVFPPQVSNVFSISQVGNYTARITDQCGYSNTLFFTVDSFSFKPVFKNGSSCNGGATTLSYPHSQYIHYKWVSPSGVAYTGDTLFINPTTAADVGLYHITQYVSINGCNDSFTTTYLLTQNSVHYYTDTICKGSSLQFGNHVYTETGIYRDTIAVSGCDSVIVLYLWVEYAHDTIVADLCPNTIFTYRNKTYTAGGIYADTITGTGCDTIVTIQIISHDYRRGTITQFICAGQQYAFAGQVYAQTGIYRDTIFSNSQCDSITTLYLGIADYLRKNITTTICAGHSYQVGNNYYNLTGMYVDTLITDEGCDSIVTLNLTVAPYPHDTINASICEGEQYKLGGKIYTTAGVYIDTFSIAGCDTIYYLQLTVLPLPEGDTTLQTFEMEYADTLQLSACGIDSAYIWSTGECGNCNVIYVSPKVLNSYYQCTIINTYGCSVVCNYKVHVNGLYGDIFVPNVFTPNGDGNNDVFKIYGNHIRMVRLMVYNRWGEKVFEGSDIANVWDGTYKGEQAPQGVYVYVLKYFAGINTNADELKGSVTLLR